MIDRNSGCDGSKNLLMLFFNLYSTISRSISGLDIQIPAIDQLPAIPSNFTQLYETVEALLESVFQQQAVLRENAADTPEDEILAYIDERIFSPDLSLSLVSEEFNKSTSYISAVFKRKRGLNYNTYINQKRIERAVELLNDSSMNTKDISTAVGYVSQSTFIRNFKKFTGHMPP